MLPPALLSVVVLAAVLLSSTTSGGQASAKRRGRSKKTGAAKDPLGRGLVGGRDVIKPLIPALRNSIDSYVSATQCEEMIGLYERNEENLAAPHNNKNLPGVHVMDIKAVIGARPADGKIWWDLIANVTARARQLSGIQNLAPSASLIHKRLATVAGESPAGGHQPHADNSEPPSGKLDLRKELPTAQFVRRLGPSGDCRNIASRGRLSHTARLTA